ncbi:uncharacterized protein PSFLO_05439 [Pseudozyma flocculosa]|uniref:Uncharacterized protein n=1 Tax=Pseudozyma flocculosa TaxID=84751 RepID=A0A5C3F8A7_9BASI|nr:uncharacterized protein PSFLO_05439 [Pseudozyma flocculosa]
MRTSPAPRASQLLLLLLLACLLAGKRAHQTTATDQTTYIRDDAGRYGTVRYKRYGKQASCWDGDGEVPGLPVATMRSSPAPSARWGRPKKGLRHTRPALDDALPAPVGLVACAVVRSASPLAAAKSAAKQGRAAQQQRTSGD